MVAQQVFPVRSKRGRGIVQSVPQNCPAAELAFNPGPFEALGERAFGFGPGGGAASRHKAGGVPADHAKGGVHGEPWGLARKAPGYRRAACPPDRRSDRPRIIPGRGQPGPQWEE